MNNLKIMGKGSELFFKEFISDNDQSVYFQMYDSIRVAILGQRLNPGEKLPPTRAIAKFCNVSRSTVQAAFDLLMAEGSLLEKSDQEHLSTTIFLKNFLLRSHQRPLQ